MDLVFIKTLKSLVDIDIKEVELREELIESLENDRINGKFSLEKYYAYYDRFGPLGKTQLDIWKSDEKMKKFFGVISQILVISRMKNNK